MQRKVDQSQPHSQLLANLESATILFSIGSIPILQVSARYRYPIPISF